MTNKIWKATGELRSGPIFNNRQKSRIQYRKRLRECEQQSTLSYSNDLHDALLNKNGAAFWKCWHSKFEGSTKCVEVDTCVDPDVIVKKNLLPILLKFIRITMPQGQIRSYRTT